MNFSKNLNRLVNVGFIGSIIVSIIIATHLAPKIVKVHDNAWLAWIGIVIAGTLVSILTWGFVGTITEIGIAAQKICEILEDSNTIEIYDDNNNQTIKSRLDKLMARQNDNDNKESS